MPEVTRRHTKGGWKIILTDTQAHDLRNVIGLNCSREGFDTMDLLNALEEAGVQ